MKKITSVLLSIIFVFVLFVNTVLAAPEYTGEVAAYAVLLIDASSGKVLYEKNPGERIEPASTTKILTCLLGIERGDLTSTVEVSRSASGMKGSKLGLVTGENVKLHDLLGGMMMTSGNDAATAVAEHVGGSVDGFVQMMNAKAKEIGMNDTNFTNVHGMHDPEHYTTANDMAKLAQYAIKNPTFMDLANRSSYIMPANNQKREAVKASTNGLMLQDKEGYYRYATGMKTGSTVPAGACLVASASKSGMDLICLIFKDESSMGRRRWSLAAELFDFGFDNYETVPVSSLIEHAEKIQTRVENHSANDMRDGLLEFEPPEAGDAYGTVSKAVLSGLQNGSDSIIAEVNYHRPEPLQAPILKGEALGTVIYKSANTGETIYEGALVASRDVLEAGTETNVSGGTAVATMAPTIPEAIRTPRDSAAIWWWLLLPGGLIVFLVFRLLTTQRKKRRRITRRKPKYSYRIRR